MAVIGNPYAQYQNSKVLTASPAELTLMLYEGIIKFINIGILAIGEKDYEKANINIMKAERIVDHLNGTLNHKYPVAKDFENIYKCIMDALLQGNIKKDTAFSHILCKLVLLLWQRLCYNKNIVKIKKI